MEINVRINETDMLGHINHANYFSYMEEGRLAYLEELDMHFNNEKKSVIVASAKCDFIRQGYFNDKLIVKTKVKKIGNSSFNLTNDILKKESNQLIAKGEVTLVYFDIDQQKSIKLPESFKEKLRKNLSTSKD